VAGEVTLDDLITDYEAAVLTPAIAALRDGPVGPVDGEVAASAIGHLSIRSAFIRGSFSGAAKRCLEHFAGRLEGHESTRELLGLDAADPQSLLEKALQEQMLADLGFLSETQREQLGRIVKFRLRERFQEAFGELSATMRQHMSTFSERMPQALAGGHVRALEKELVPKRRAQRLRSFSWNLHELDVRAHLILPDCLAMASPGNNGAKWMPYVSEDDETITAVAMPVSATRVLIGGDGDGPPDWHALNRASAACALDFFVSSRNEESIATLADTIGESVSGFSLQMVEDEAFLAPPVPDLKTHAGQASALPRVQSEQGHSVGRQVEEALLAQMRRLEIARCLSYLDAVVVTPHVADALKRRGVQLNEVGAQSEQYGSCLPANA
jgi:hypothetical protein